MGLADLRRWLDDACAVGDICVGVQLHIDLGNGTEWSHAAGVDGLKVPIRDSSLGLLRCAVSKPATALCLAQLADRGALSFQARLGSVIAAPLHPALQ